MTAVFDAIVSLRAEATGYPVWVQVWMKLMAASFVAGVIVAWWDRRALWVAGMAVLTALGMVMAKVVWPDLARADIGSVLHLAVWPLALPGLWRGVAASGFFRLWRVWVSGLAGVSLLLDLRHLIG